MPILALDAGTLHSIRGRSRAENGGRPASVCMPFRSYTTERNGVADENFQTPAGFGCIGRQRFIQCRTSNRSAIKVTAPTGNANVIIGSIHAPVDGLPQPADSVLKGFSRYVVEGTGGPLTYKSRLREQEAGTGPGTYAAWTQMLDEGLRKVLMERILCLPTIVRLKGDEQAQVAATLYLHALTRKSAAEAAGYAAYRCTRPGVRSRDQILQDAAQRNDVPRFSLEDPDEVESVVRHSMSESTGVSCESPCTQVH